jgi:hypothetical protein
MPGQELQGAGTGATVAGLTGAAMPLAGGAAGKVSQAIGNAGTDIARAVNKASGGRMLDRRQDRRQAPHRRPEGRWGEPG